MCGRATGWRGELRLAKLSLAVSDSFLPERRNIGNEETRRRDDERKRGRKREDAEGPTIALRAVSPRFLPRSGILRPVKRVTDFQFFIKLHATSSRSNSLSRLSPHPRLLCTFCSPSLLIFPLYFSFLFLPSFSLREEKLQAKPENADREST